ncbi:unnamed protein product [Prorocentrum cordatum]|uniref:Uncharacterized protein n=1 Tax=Prorocentrum cordatum TaxID=2364126 RepID=A0ABN9SI36_9DINO|nr:unnamed protein product [Polarella glacialis]
MISVEFEEAKTSSNSVSVESAGYASCVGLTSCIGPSPAVQTTSELLPPARVKHMPTDRKASSSADKFTDIAPASIGPHALRITSPVEAGGVAGGVGSGAGATVTSSNWVSDEPTGYAHSVGLTSRIDPKPAIQPSPSCHHPQG